MSDQAPQQPAWIWSPRLQQWYYHDQRTDQYVLANGARIPRHVNATMNELPQSSQPESSPSSMSEPFYGSYTATASTRRQPPPSAAAGESSLTAQFRGMQIGTDTQNRVTTNQRRESSGLITDSIDNVTRVRTISQTEPKEAITDTNLLREGGLAHRMLRPTPNEEETLDPRFKVRDRPARFFCVGRVFLILWAEPAGETSQSVASGPTVLSDMSFTLGALGQYVHQKVRRFVVVREGDLFCTALPVLTYGGHGVSRHKVKKSDHAIIYSSKSPPKAMEQESPKRGEEGMRPNSIRVDPDEKEDKLDPVSRIDFGKPHTVHHNLKVRPFGMVNEKSMSHLLSQFKAVVLDGLTTRRRSSTATGGSASRGIMPGASTGTTVRDYGQTRTTSQRQRRVPQRGNPDNEEESSDDEDDTSDEE